MKKILIIPIALIMVISGLVTGYITKNDDSVPSQNKQELTKETKELHLKSYEASVLYAKAGFVTELVLQETPDDTSYELWQNHMGEVISMWEELEEMSEEIDDLADDAIDVAEEKQSFNMFYTEKAFAADKLLDFKEINAIYDAAPAGRRIKTLAKHFNGDSKKAYQMLKIAQNQTTAEAWNEAGDVFETLENTARVIKDVSKVTVYVGGAVLSGGTTSTVGTILAEGGAILSGVDLVFEIGEDVSAIAFGYNHESVAMLGDLRKVTEPAASIIGLFGITNATNAYDRWNAVAFGVDQINSAIQDDKYLGIKVDFDKLAVEATGMNESETEEWLESEKIKEEPINLEEIIDFTDIEETFLAYEDDLVIEKIEDPAETDFFIDDLDTVVEEDEDIEKKGILGIWKVRGINSKDTIPEDWRTWFYVLFEEDGRAGLLKKSRSRFSGYDYEFDESSGTGNMSYLTLEYGVTGQTLYIRTDSSTSAVEYWYLEKINEDEFYE